MALAIKFHDLIDRGEVKDYADLARLGHVSRSRITQIMNLLNLAPEIQERLLFGTESGGLWDSNFSEARLNPQQQICFEHSIAELGISCIFNLVNA